jgi:hypothetical protein
MSPALPPAYAVRHIYAPNESPYAPSTRRGRSAGRRRRRRSPLALSLPSPDALFRRRAVTGR